MPETRLCTKRGIVVAMESTVTGVKRLQPTGMVNSGGLAEMNQSGVTEPTVLQGLRASSAATHTPGGLASRLTDFAAEGNQEISATASIACRAPRVKDAEILLRGGTGSIQTAITAAKNPGGEAAVSVGSGRRAMRARGGTIGAGVGGSLSANKAAFSLGITDRPGHFFSDWEPVSAYPKTGRFLFFETVCTILVTGLTNS